MNDWEHSDISYGIRENVSITKKNLNLNKWQNFKLIKNSLILRNSFHNIE